MMFVVDANTTSYISVMGKAGILPPSMRQLMVGKIHHLYALKHTLIFRAAQFQRQVQLPAASTFYSQAPLLQMGCNQFFFGKYESACFVSIAPMCPYSDDAPDSLLFAHWISHLVRGSHTSIRSVFASLCKTLTILLRAARNICASMCMAVSQRANFIVHGFHPPASSQQLSDTLSRREWSVGPA